MTNMPLRELSAFLAVAEEGSFTAAARRQGISQSALSQTVRILEESMGMQLFARTTRSVALTEAGAKLQMLVSHPMGEIARGLAQMGELRHRPAGIVRITADAYALSSVLWPAMRRFLPLYPDINVELVVEDSLVDIISSRYDAGVRRGGLVAKDMVTTRIGPDIPMAVVASPSYFVDRGQPSEPRFLVDHDCINLRLPGGEMFHWRFGRGDSEQRINVSGRLTFSALNPVVDAAVEGYGLAFVPRGLVEGLLESGALEEVLQDWRFAFEGYHLYYPDRRKSPAFALLVDILRYRD